MNVLRRPVEIAVLKGRTFLHADDLWPYGDSIIQELMLLIEHFADTVKRSASPRTCA